MSNIETINIDHFMLRDIFIKEKLMCVINAIYTNDEMAINSGMAQFEAQLNDIARVNRYRNKDGCFNITVEVLKNTEKFERFCVLVKDMGL
jgi:hypothetical protein